MKRKIMVPAVSVGLLVTGREAAAGVVDFGIVAESLSINVTFSGITAGNTVGGYTLGGLTFVGSHLSDVITTNTVTNTVSNILTQLLGPQGLTLTFGFPGNGGASGGFTVYGPGGLGLVNNTVTLTENTIGGIMTTCTSSNPVAGTGCAAGTPVQLTPFDPAELLQNLNLAGVVSLSSSPWSNGAPVEFDTTATITLGSDANGNTVIGEELITTDSIAATAVPEPAGWPLTALGSAFLAWWRRRR